MKLAFRLRDPIAERLQRDRLLLVLLAIETQLEVFRLNQIHKERTDDGTRPGRGRARP